MAYKRVILREAQRDYEGIVAYLADILKNPQAASNFMEEFDRKINLARDNPELFGLSRMPELAAKGYRSIFVGSYVVLFKVHDDAVAVAHVFHQSQDYARLV